MVIMVLLQLNKMMSYYMKDLNHCSIQMNSNVSVFSFPFSSAMATLAYLFHQDAPPLKRTSALPEKSGNFQ